MSAKVLKISAEKHEGDIMSVAFNNGYVFTGGADGQIKVWNSEVVLQNTLDFGDYVFSIVVTPVNKVYASSSDGSVKFCEDPIKSNTVEDLLRCDDVILAMVFVDGHLYTGDEKGVVTKWKNDKIVFKYNLVEEVKTLGIQNNSIYTARDLDVVISEILPGKSGRYTTKGVMPGKSPLALVGPTKDGSKEFLVFADRSGKGLAMVNNLPGQNFLPLWTVEDLHEMIVNGICGSERLIFSGGYDGKVKCLTNINEKNPQVVGEADIGSCVNGICIGEKENIVYVGSSDGILRKVVVGGK
ncbi:hypothetical protein ACFFRR_004143 [Megaselia abdita]